MSFAENNCDEDPVVPPGVAYDLGLRRAPWGVPVGMYSANDGASRVLV